MGTRQNVYIISNVPHRLMFRVLCPWLVALLLKAVEHLGGGDREKGTGGPWKVILTSGPNQDKRSSHC